MLLAYQLSRGNNHQLHCLSCSTILPLLLLLFLLSLLLLLFFLIITISETVSHASGMKFKKYARHQSCDWCVYPAVIWIDFYLLFLIQLAFCMYISVTFLFSVFFF